MLALLGTTALAGCAPARPTLHSPPPRPVGLELQDTRSGADTPGSATDPIPEPTGVVTLRDAIAAALSNNPQLAAFSFETRAKEAEALQAGARPNPELTAGLESFAGSGDLSGFGASETTISLSQLVELGGKRSRRVDIAGFDHDLAAWDYETARLDVLTETKKAFVEVIVAQEQRALAEELVEVAEEILDSVSRRVKAGATSPVEEYRANVEVETSRIDLIQTQRALGAARVRLAGMWGGTAPEFHEVVGDIETTDPPPSLEALTARLAQNPQLARWATELELRRATLELERSLGTPDLALGAGVRYSKEADAAALVAEAGIALPIFDRNRDATRAAELRVHRGEQEGRAAQVRLQTEVSATHETLVAAEAEIRALRDRALPEAEAAFEAAQEAYLRGSLRLSDVLDTERLFFELKGHYFDAIQRYHGAIAEIERLTGEPLEAARTTPGRHQP